MSIRDRLEDARILFAANRVQGAFIQVLIAAAATSRKRYSKSEWDDGESFKNFIYDEMGVITGGPKYEVELPFLGKPTPLEDILYIHLRCQLLHEATFPESINLTEPREDGANILHLGTPLGFPIGWIQQLATAVWLAPENDSLWPDEIEKRRVSCSSLSGLLHDVPFCRRPGQQTIKMKGKNQKLSWSVNGQTLAISFPPGLSQSELAELIEDKARKIREG
ncbi:MAG: hypothetical protein C0478_03215 [Planctomyces sp.]|nr:hypothetical protein [Planctomyces sp.]